MPDRKQINVRLDPEQKERWERYAEDDKRVNGGISGLVRTAVEAFIDPEQSQSASESTDFPDDLSTRLDTIANRLQDVQHTVERTDESVGYIETELFQSDERPFSDKLIRAIPPARPYSQKWEDDKAQYEDRREGEPIAWEGTVNAFANQLDSERETIKQSLEALIQQQDSFVKAGTVDEVRRFWTERDLERQPYADGRKVEEEVARRKFRNRQEGRE